MTEDELREAQRHYNEGTFDNLYDGVARVNAGPLIRDLLAEVRRLREKCRAQVEKCLHLCMKAEYEARAVECERIAKYWDDTETRSAEAHAIYQEEAHRRGDIRHPDAYVDLSESTKEWDRVLVRWVARSIRALKDKP